MNDDVVKAHLHQKLRAAREALLGKLDGLAEYDIRRPMTATGTNLLGLVKHNAISDSRYFGDVFDRPFPEPLPRWDDPAADFADHWATEHETRDEIVDLYRRVWAHSDATIETLNLDDRGYVPWWQEEVPLFNVMAARLVDAVRHAGHADILREWLDGRVGVDADSLPLHGRDSSYWEARRALIENAARAAQSGPVRLEDLVAALRDAVTDGDVPQHAWDIDGVRCELARAGLTNHVVIVDDGDARRCVKLYRSTVHHPDRREYEALRLIARHCPDRAPRPIAHLPAPVLPAVVTEWIPGVALSDRPLAPAEVISLTECLVAIHDLDTTGVPAAVTTPPQLAVSGVRAMLANLSTEDPLVERALNEATAWLASSDAELITKLSCSSWGRGDPNLENVLVDTAGHARVVDLELSGVTNVTFEIADMVEHLRSHRVAWPDWAPLIDRLIPAKDRRAFASCRRLASTYWLAMLIADPLAREINGPERQTVQAERVLTVL